MKKTILNFLIAVFFGLIFPGMVFWNLPSNEKQICEFDPTIPSVFSAQESPDTQITGAGAEPTIIRVILKENDVREMDLEEYITGVVLGEMPVSFSEEALKAQAVVARTFALQRVLHGDKHSIKAVCTDPGCCQAYISQECFLDQGGTKDQIEKIQNCVLQCAGQVLIYGDDLIEATYFSSSGGRTEDAVEVWGTDVPYLQAKDSPGEENPHVESVTFTAQEIQNKLNLPNVPVSVKDIAYTSGNGVKNITISGKKFSGTTVRSLLHLKSTIFRMSVVGDHIIITSKGYGHRVGMSQYGADYMGKQGNTYGEILQYYYPGTELVNLHNIDKAGLF